MEKEKYQQDSSKRTRKNQIIIRCSDEELLEINQAIEKSGLSRVDFILSVLQKGHITVVDDLKEICVELKKQGINLNQSLRFSYQSGDQTYLMKSIQACHAVYEQAKNLLLATEHKVKNTRKRGE